ncbi:MAG: retropepsin-like aspartic protease [Candidatus Dojkabacteria bacterium]
MSSSKPRFAFTSRYKGRSLCLINKINILPPRDFPDIKFSQRELKAIWDTGASHTCITEKLAQELKLIPISKRDTNTAGGIKIVNVYIVDIQLPNKLIIPSIQVSAVNLPNTADALIGMDIIGLGDFSVTNYQGNTVFSLRIPSCREIDYAYTVKESQKKKLSAKEKKQKKSKRKYVKKAKKQSRKK